MKSESRSFNQAVNPISTGYSQSFPPIAHEFWEITRCQTVQFQRRGWFRVASWVGKVAPQKLVPRRLATFKQCNGSFFLKRWEMRIADIYMTCSKSAWSLYFRSCCSWFNVECPWWRLRCWCGFWNLQKDTNILVFEILYCFEVSIIQ